METRRLEARRELLEKEWEALEADSERQRKWTLQRWQQLMCELQQLLASVPEGRLLFRQLIERLFEACQGMSPSTEQVVLMKKIIENRNDLLSSFDKELEELAEKMMALSSPENQSKIRKEMAERWANMRMTPPHVDFVTGLNNTRFFNEIVTSEIERADRYQLSLAIVCIDIDHFRQVNEIYGHVAGNNILRSVADLVRSSVRRTDLVFRSGDDEFTV